MKITKLETFLVKPRWLFLKMHTDEGLVGLGEPILEGRALTCARGVEELAPYLIGKDPRRVVYHWQAMYRHAFYRGGPLLRRCRMRVSRRPRPTRPHSEGLRSSAAASFLQPRDRSPAG